GSGVDGLAAMRGDWQADGQRWLRPLMQVSRQSLRDWLGAHGIEWVDDPGNDDTRYARVRARAALASLAPLGITAEGLSATATRLSRARATLSQAAYEAARAHCRTQLGDVVFAPAALDLPEETLTRLTAHALCWVASAAYRPRYDALVHALAQVRAGQGASLHGCVLTPGRGGFRISREYQADTGMTTTPSALWDQRWRLAGPVADATIAALGEALVECPDWRDTGLARTSLRASPAVFRAGRLIAAPLAGCANGWSAEFDPKRGDFHDTLLFH
ncbi:MAG TPA: tRNA(Ile)-lysidine synthetase, partial [Aliiroseovarius sp.]|nr:tRNA(Ile)-lysidine synthetase [Aliiroseovarius sp.]